MSAPAAEDDGGYRAAGWDGGSPQALVPESRWFSIFPASPHPGGEADEGENDGADDHSQKETEP
jgi:hypothetical protein